MDFQSTSWTLFPLVILNPREYENVPFEFLLQHPRALAIKPEYIDNFIRLNGKDKTKFIYYLNSIQDVNLFSMPCVMPRLMTRTQFVPNWQGEIVENTQPVIMSEFDMISNPVIPVNVQERRSFFTYIREMGDFHIETYVTMYDTHLYYDEICVYNDPNSTQIEGDVNTTPMREIVFHWQITKYNIFCNHTKVPIDSYDFSDDADIFKVNLSERCVQESTFGHWDLYVKLLKEHQKLSKMSKEKFEAERIRMIAFVTSEDISNMRSLRKGINLPYVYERLVETRLLPLLQEQNDNLDDDAWLFGEIYINDIPPVTPW